MNIAIFVSTPAQAYFFKNIVRALEQKGHVIRVLARDYRETLLILDSAGIPYHVFARVSASKYGKMAGLPRHILAATRYLRGQRVDIIVGTGVYSVFPALFLRRPNIVFMDEVSTEIELRMQRPFLDALVTPSNLPRDLGEKHLRVNSFKELSYLHPRYFKADPDILRLLGVGKGEKFAVLRFNAFDSSHDVGATGFTERERRRLVDELGRYGRVFVSSEIPLSPDLNLYALRIPKERIHHVLNFAHLLVADATTMVTEAAMLGTPAILYHPKAKRIGNFIELEREYDLVHAYEKPSGVIDDAVELFRSDGLRMEWKVKQEKLLAEKIDIARFLTWFIEEFPDSFRLCKTDPAYGQGLARSLE